MSSTYSKLLWITARRCRNITATTSNQVFMPRSELAFNPISKHFSTGQPLNSLPNEKNVNLPTKETLLRIDWMLEKLFLKETMAPFLEICSSDVHFEDKIFNYKSEKRSQLHQHIARVRVYYRYLSPYNKVERIGSCIYEGEDVIVLLWRLTTQESNIWSYFPSFITKKEQKYKIIEGALDIHVTKTGEVYKIINRKMTKTDREGSFTMDTIKKEQGEIKKKEQEKALKEEGDAFVEEQKRRGLL